MVEKSEYKLEGRRFYYWHPPKRLEDIDLLEDVDLSDIRDNPPIDKEIAPLVRALRGLGLVTMGSCEGHLDGIRYPRPWVTVYGLWRYEEIFPIIESYNQTSELKWTIEGTVLETVQEASNKTELEGLQESARKLAGFLFDNYIKQLYAVEG